MLLLTFTIAGVGILLAGILHSIFNLGVSLLFSINSLRDAVSANTTAVNTAVNRLLSSSNDADLQTLTDQINTNTAALNTAMGVNPAPAPTPAP